MASSSLKIWFLSLSFGLLTSLSASAQSVTPTPTPRISEDDTVIRVETELIDVPVVVTDKTGRPITDLKQSNFVVLEDGKPQKIESFSTTAAPFEVVLLLDTSGSTRGELDLIKNSAQEFINLLRPGDRVAIVAFGGERGSPAKTNIISRLTTNRNELRSSLDKLTTSNGTPYYDSLLEIMNTIFDRPETGEYTGRRAVVALTDGVDSTSSDEFAAARTRLESGGIISYFIKVDTREFFESELLGDCQSAIRFSAAQIRRYYRTIGGRNVERVTDFCQLGDFERLAVSKTLYGLADKEMTELAQRSGGKVFPVADLGGAREAFRDVAAQIGTNYSLGYYSSNESQDGKFRKITVQLKGLPAGAQVRAREGYTAGNN